MSAKYLTPEDLRAITAPAEERAPKGSRWRHRKGGEYVVEGVGISEGSQRPVVIYRPVTGDQPPWLRSADEFFDGRFEMIHMPVISRAEIEAAVDANGKGATKDLLRSWGVPWPPPRGWKKELLQRADQAAARTEDGD